MQEAIIFTIFLVGGWLGLILLHATKRIVGFFIDEYKDTEVELKNSREACRILKLREDKHLAEIKELKEQIRFHEILREAEPDTANN